MSSQIVSRGLADGAVVLSTAKVTGTLPIAKGGTNSTTALNNNRVMKSSGGAIIEAAAITANRALASDSNGIPVHTAVTDTELGYVSGVTSAIQTQLNARALATRNINTASLSGLAGGGDLSADRNLVVNPDNATSVAVASGDEILIADVSAGNALKKVTAGDIAALATGSTWAKETFVLSGTDITNGYVDLAQVARNSSIDVLIDGWGGILEGASYGYTVSYTGGAGGKTRVTWLNSLATGGDALVAADVIQIGYSY